jgi:hypothetical protein
MREHSVFIVFLRPLRRCGNTSAATGKVGILPREKGIPEHGDFGLESVSRH